MFMLPNQCCCKGAVLMRIGFFLLGDPTKQFTPACYIDYIYKYVGEPLETNTQQNNLSLSPGFRQNNPFKKENRSICAI